jgi:quercetin dioxygenase-like cupin family protein
VIVTFSNGSYEPTDNPFFGATRSPKHGGPDIEAPILHFDLHAELEQLKRQRNYQERGPAGRTLVKEPDLRIVLMALKADARMREHHASGPISLEVIAGTIRVRLPDASIELAVGKLLALASGIHHDVEAIDDSAFLLTIGRTRYENVSEHHEPYSWQHVCANSAKCNHHDRLLTRELSYFSVTVRCQLPTG